MDPEATFKTQFVKIQKLTKNIFTAFFEKPKDFEFIAGQYLKLYLPIEAPDNRGISRYFSISSSPLFNYITITTNVGISSFKKKLISLKAGEEVKFLGPWGEFILNMKNNRPKLLLAGGVGLTPYHSMLTYYDMLEINSPIILIATFSSLEEAVFYDDFKKISERHTNVKIIYSLTKEEIEGMERGRISKELIQKYTDRLEDYDIFLVGPPPMVNDTLDILEEIGVSQEKVILESFTGY